MSRLHRTPVHLAMLRAVYDREIGWSSGIGVTGGFQRIVPARMFLNPNDLCALWEMLHAGLIAVEATRVLLTNAGSARLHEWQVRA